MTTCTSPTGLAPEPTAQGCVFCRIVTAEEPATVVRRWPDAIAIVPRRPVVTGHLLILSTHHVAHVAADPQVSAAAMAAAAELAAAYQHCNVITSRGELATQSVAHLHLHVLPRNLGDGLSLPWTKATSPVVSPEAAGCNAGDTASGQLVV